MAKKMTITEYCALSGRLKQAVSRDIKNSKTLKGVTKIERIGRTPILHVDLSVFNTETK